MANISNESDETAFFESFQHGDITKAKELLKLVRPSSLQEWRTSEDKTCLHVAVLAGDPGLLRGLAEKLRDSGLIDIIKKTDEKGDTALHSAVRRDRVDLVEQLVDLHDNLCDCTNKKGETPLKMAVSLGFKEAVEFLITRTSNALHYIVELNQVRLVQFLIKKKVDLSGLINQPYQPDKENCATNPSDNEGNRATNPEHVQPIDGGDQKPKEKATANAPGDGGDKPSQSAARNKNKPDEERPQIVKGDTPLHIAARNKYEHMVNLLLKVRGVNKLARNGEDKTPFDIAREVMEYLESFRIIRRLEPYGEKPRPFMYCAPQVSHKKLMEARKKVNEAYETRRNAELVVAALLAAMTCAAAFTVPGGFDPGSTETEQLNCTPMANSNSTQMEKLNSTQMEKEMKELGSPLLIHLISFKLFIIFDCIAFFLSLFVCIMWEMSSELTTGDKMLFMTVNGLVVCCSFGFTAYGFMAAVYAMLARKVKTFSWVVLGTLIAITVCGVLAFIHQSVQFIVMRARFHRLCGVSCFFDDIVEDLWSRAERCGLLKLVRSGDEVSRDLLTGHRKFSELLHEHEISPSSPFNPVSGNNSPSPLLNRDRSPQP